MRKKKKKTCFLESGEFLPGTVEPVFDSAGDPSGRLIPPTCYIDNMLTDVLRKYNCALKRTFFVRILLCDGLGS